MHSVDQNVTQDLRAISSTWFMQPTYTYAHQTCHCCNFLCHCTLKQSFRSISPLQYILVCTPKSYIWEFVNHWYVWVVVEAFRWKPPSTPRVLLFSQWLRSRIAHTFLMTGLPICWINTKSSAHTSGDQRSAQPHLWSDKCAILVERYLLHL